MDMYDVRQHTETLNRVGVNTAEALAPVRHAQNRAARIGKIRKEARKAVEQAQRELFADLDLDDTNAVITAIDRVASMQNREHAEKVDRLYEIAIADADSDAVRAFKRVDFLRILRPVFDEIAARIVTAAETIPYGVMSIGDAARLQHGDRYARLEEDVQHWLDIEEMLTDLIRGGVIKLGDDRYYATEVMLEDTDAYRETLAGVRAPMRVARAVAAGRPNLHKPTTPHTEYQPTDGQVRDSDRWKRQDANDAEKAARAALGLAG